MDLKKCRLYRLNSHQLLAKILDCSVQDLKNISKKPNDFYRVFEIKRTGKKSRGVQDPKPGLKKIHKKIKFLFKNLILPDYVHSGVKGRGYKGNAQAHLGNKYAVTLDIQNFFPSCSEQLVWKFFYNKMKMAPDVARTLSKVCCYNGHIPTGSPISSLLAYLVNAGLFDQINENAISLGQTFSLYVDDMTFSTSSMRISKTYHLFIDKLLASNGLNLHKDKVKYFGSHQDKLITGCKVTTKNQLRASDKLKKNIFKPLADKKVTQLTSEELRSTLGRINSASYIEGEVLVTLKEKVKKQLA